MADVQHSVSTPRIHPSTFDPFDWMARFAAVGGFCIASSEGGLSIGRQVRGTTDEQMKEARKIHSEVQHDDMRLEAILDACLIGRPANRKDV